MNHKRILWVGGLAAAVLALSACGNGNDDAPPPPATQVPPEAVASTQAFVAFLKALPPSETAEPLGLGGLVPPTSETEEPVEIN